MAVKERYESSSLGIIAAICTCWSVQVLAAKTDVPLFLFSGQSNMVGLGTSTNDLTAAQKATYPDIKIYLDAEGDATKLRKWSTLGPGFGGSSTGFGPELFFGKVLADSFPGKKFAFIKVARSGTYLGKVAEWLPPSSNNGTGGTYYTSMMGSIDAALKAFSSAFDTSLYTPKWVGFIWLQGEFDAMDAALSNQYETNLNNLIKDIRTKAGIADLPVILPMIDVQSMWTNNAKIRAADVAMKTKLARVDTMDTKGLPTDNIHYKAAGMIVIGQRCAARWIAMKYPVGPTGISDWSRRPAASIRPMPDGPRFDLSGRRTGRPGSNPTHAGTSSLWIDQRRDLKLIYSLPSQ